MSVEEKVHESVATLPTMPCSCRVLSSDSCDSSWCSERLPPALDGRCSQTSLRTSHPKAQEETLSFTPSPVKHSTWRSIMVTASLSPSNDETAWAQFSLVMAGGPFHQIGDAPLIWPASDNCKYLYVAVGRGRQSRPPFLFNLPHTYVIVCFFVFCGVIY